ncbi:peptide/nickel transport system substrate-binding protein [Kribbella sp. VKM Ac-2571]|uniref:ABC transporter substrate-binding protein n=1 Tax=Kribbella sp. VKM Ac-2571 TaxID=2512222 RepID=UPI0010600D4A|nr:ABC transporter substrate-binding protein [Kribbella sp. VKM Ac-2571]TDO55059.1 peptide/nickel transport system substrate-binding protein [Kribbella sp. VKM Ac-2571]
MKPSFSTRAVAVLASAALLAVTACSAGSGTSGGSSPGADQKLSIGLVAEPASLDFTTTDGAAIPQALLGNVYETLVKQDDSGKIVPSLAKSWTVSPDRKTYTFDLVDNAKFTNDKQFTANDAVFSINRVKTAWTTSLKAAMDVVSQAKALSPTQLQVTLAKPSNDWLFRMTTRIGAMFSESGVSALATAPVGSGPFKFSKWNRGDSIVMVRNDNYWGSKPFFQQITLKYFKDATALNNALLTGTINVVGTVQAPEALSQFTSNDKYQVIEGTTNGEVLLSFNNSLPLFKDVRTRQGIRMAIDHKALLDTCWAGRGKLIGSMVPPTDPWYEDLTGVAPYDLAKAKSLLQASGAAGKTLRLRLPTLPYATSCGQVVKSQLEQAGLKVAIDQLEFPAAWLTTVFKNADYDMSIIAHVEPRDLGAVFNPKYYTRYDDPTLQGYLAAADSGDEAAQVDNMKKAARRLSEQAAGDWLFLLPNLMVADKSVKGLPTNAITENFDLSKLAR